MVARHILVTTALVTLVGSARTAAAVSYLQGTFPLGQFGYAVRDAGDVNDDGWPDLVVGAPRDNTRGLSAGRAFLWLGGSGLRVAADLILDDGTGEDQYGFSVAGIGDVNDDGYDDVAVGSPYQDRTGADAGSVFVYFGGPFMNATADLILDGAIAGDHFGWSVSHGGDLTGDGIDDFLVGAPHANQNAQDNGAVYLFVGSSGTVSTQPARVFVGEVGGDHFGWSVSDVPDFRGLGVGSILVGAPHTGLDAGTAYLFYGAAAGIPDATADVILRNNVGGEEFGFAVSHIGRFHDAGFTDVVVGAPGAFGDRGYVRVYYGESNPPAQPAADMTIAGQDAGDRFGAAAADVVNFDGAGRDDFVVGAPSRDQPAKDAGHVYLFHGGSTYTLASQGDAIAAGNPVGSPADDLFGTSVSTVGGDLDGDGRGDIIVGAPFGNDASGTSTGVAALVGSGSGIVPVANIPFHMTDVGEGLWQLVFGGFAARARTAVLYAVEVPGQPLARLGENLRATGETLVATLPVSSLQGVSEVELVLDVDGVAMSQRFAVAVPASRIVLHRAWPNPFNPATRLRFELASTQPFELYVVDARGRRVRTLQQGAGLVGAQEAVFDGRDDQGRLLASGAYRAVLEVGAVQRSTGLLLLK
jgi:hypothetical protein